MTENKYLADGPLVVAIDSSTTSTKAIVVDAEGNIWHTSNQNIQLHTPTMDQYEHNPIRWWETSRATIGEVLSKLSPTDRSRIAAIGITHQRESFAPFDKEGRRSETASYGSTAAPPSRSAATAASTFTSSPESRPASPTPPEVQSRVTWRPQRLFRIRPARTPYRAASSVDR